jgi:DNA-binding NtrC family response regulator
MNRPDRRDETEPLSLRSEHARGLLEEPGGWWLSLYHRDGGQTAVLREAQPLVVGRARPADLVIDHPSLSRQHARFVLADGEVIVEDLGSTNGTWLGGESVSNVRLRVGEELLLGAVTAMLHAPSGGVPGLGLDGHDRFLAQLDTDVQRGRWFHRPLAAIMIRSAKRGAGAQVHNWITRVQPKLRPVDRAGLYSPEVLEILLVESTVDDARRFARALAAETAGAEQLLCGVSVFPDCASSAEAVVATVREALLRAAPEAPVVVAELAAARTVSSVPPAPGVAGVIAESAAMKQTLEMGRRLARGVIPVLLQGETGSGKEVVARFIHDQSPRHERPLVAVNSGALPAQLVESTLFGHEKGAFTGASQRHAGVFEAADGGTVFLDEIGELPAEAQASLLRVLENKTVTRVGSTKELPVDVRIVAASHRDLEAMVVEGRFREDLLYRLNAMTLQIPPLRERREDIAELARHFLELANAANQTTVEGFEADVIEALEQHDWPGNVRELRNAIERAVLIAEGDVITLEDLPQRVRRSGDGPRPAKSVVPATVPALAAVTTGAACRPDEDYRACMARLDAEVLSAALREVGWRQVDAAKRLAMPRRTLVHKIRALGLKKPG